MSLATDEDITELLDVDDVAVEPSRGAPGFWDVFTDPGHYWATVTTAQLVALKACGEVWVFDRRTGEFWQPNG